MCNPDKVRFFDGIAARWDGWIDHEQQDRQLAEGLTLMGLRADEVVLDLGCGTGSLTAVLLGKLGERGRVVAVDISPAMLAQARAKISDERVSWHVGDVCALPVEDASIDRVLCYSVWPHFDDYAAAIREIERVLRPGGQLHVWHLISRSHVNEVHAKADPAVAADVLLPASDTARLLGEHGMVARALRDDAEGYLVTAYKEASR